MKQEMVRILALMRNTLVTIAVRVQPQRKRTMPSGRVNLGTVDSAHAIKRHQSERDGEAKGLLRDDALVRRARRGGL